MWLYDCNDCSLLTVVYLSLFRSIYRSHVSDSIHPLSAVDPLPSVCSSCRSGIAASERGEAGADGHRAGDAQAGGAAAGPPAAGAGGGAQPAAAQQR